MEEDIKKMMDQKQQEAQVNIMIKEIMSKSMEPGARERLANVKMVKPDVARNLEMYIYQLYQSNQLKEKLTENQLIDILKKINEKKEMTIRRK